MSATISMQNGLIATKKVGQGHLKHAISVSALATRNRTNFLLRWPQSRDIRDETPRVREYNSALEELHAFKHHPFKVVDDEAMKEAAESISKHGVLVPAIARPREEGGYELISGHRRKRASELAGKDTMPVIVRNLDDDAATIILVDSNIQRENVLPSERAHAYKLKLEAMKRQGERTDLTSRQVGTKFRADERLADSVGC